MSTVASGGVMGVSPLYRHVVANARRALSLAEIGEVTGVGHRAVQKWAQGAGRPESLSRERLLELSYVMERVLDDVYDDEGVDGVTRGNVRRVANPWNCSGRASSQRCCKASSDWLADPGPEVIETRANRIASISPVSVHGTFYRHAAPNRDAFAGGVGGRWGEAFPVFYLGRPRTSVIAEAYRHLSRRLACRPSTCDHERCTRWRCASTRCST